MRNLRKLSVCTAVMLAALVGFSGSLLAQSDPALAIPGAPVAVDVPGARDLPDPGMTYKVVFDIAKAAPKIDDVNPGLIGIARYVNTLAKYGVPASHRKIAVVFHQAGTEVILDSAAFKERNGGHDNPNLALIRSMKEAGVDFRVCGQAVMARKIDPKTINPDIELDLWALTTITNFQLRGYAYVGGN